MVVGDGEIAGHTLKCFNHLCNEKYANVVVLNLDGRARVNEADLKKHGAHSVTVINSLSSDTKALTLALLKAHGVWIEGNADAITKNELTIGLLNNVSKRGGVIAVDSQSHALLACLGDIDPPRRLESPFARIEFHFGESRTIDTPSAEMTVEKVHCLVPDSSVVVFHRGREIAGYGKEISFLVRKRNGWPARRDWLECPKFFNSKIPQFFGLDLFSWIRSANERARPVFPPKLPSEPELVAGSLILSGSFAGPADTLTKFVELAGGKDSPIVCIASSPTGVSAAAKTLKIMSVKSTITLSAQDPLVADQTEEFAKRLNQASGVWIEGGRTFEFADRYQGTQIETMIADVLKRGGVVGGHGCGSQVLSDFMVRANPRINTDISYEGYTRGYGLLKGVIVDVNFTQYRRQKQLHDLVKQHPQMLGIGIDNDTAIIVQGHTATVIGENTVSFYDLESNPGDDFKPEVLKAGEKYDLKSRSRLP